MHEIKLRAPGKINWTLDVVGKRLNGYHDVEMLMQSIDLSDEVILTRRASGIVIRSNSGEMPLNDWNIAVRAAKLIKESYAIKEGLDIFIQKNIPIAAGLAGGSTDGAAVIVGLNVLWNLGLSFEQLAALGIKLGADVPFCITGGTAIARGIGEKLTHLTSIDGVWLVLVKPSFGVSTASVYKGLILEDIKQHPDVDKVYNQLAARDYQMAAASMVNVLEQVTIAQYTEIDDIKHALIQEGAVISLMTGSGPTVYGVFRERNDAFKTLRKMREVYPQAYAVQTWSHGIEIVKGDDQ